MRFYGREQCSSLSYLKKTRIFGLEYMRRVAQHRSQFFLFATDRDRLRLAETHLPSLMCE